VSRRLVLLALAVAACRPLPVPRGSPYHSSDADLGVTRVVHGSLIVEMQGARVLIDPWFHSGVFVRQREPLGLLPKAMPSADAVLLTQGHADHFDARALRVLAPKIPLVLAPPGLHERLAGLGFARIVDLDWWDTADVGPIRVTAVPARHDGPANGYVLEAGRVGAYVAGDTRRFPQLVDVATRFPHLDAAVLPVGGRRFFGVRREMGPVEAAEAAALLDPRRVIPYNYGQAGGFPVRLFARNPVGRFIDECTARGFEPGRLVVLEPGESWHYYREGADGE